MNIHGVQGLKMIRFPFLCLSRTSGNTRSLSSKLSRPLRTSAETARQGLEMIRISWQDKVAVGSSTRPDLRTGVVIKIKIVMKMNILNYIAQCLLSAKDDLDKKKTQSTHIGADILYDMSCLCDRYVLIRDGCRHLCWCK